MCGVAILPVDNNIEDQNLICKWYEDDGNFAGDHESLIVHLVIM